MKLSNVITFQTPLTISRQKIGIYMKRIIKKEKEMNLRIKMQNIKF